MSRDLCHIDDDRYEYCYENGLNYGDYDNHGRYVYNNDEDDDYGYGYDDEYVITYNGEVKVSGEVTVSFGEETVTTEIINGVANISIPTKKYDNQRLKDLNDETIRLLDEYLSDCTININWDSLPYDVAKLFNEFAIILVDRQSARHKDIELMISGLKNIINYTNNIF